MSIYVPYVQTEYILQGLFEQKTFAKLMAARIFDASTIQSAFGNEKSAGDYVNIPRLTAMADFARVDIDTTTDLSPTAAATNNDKVIICRDAAINSFTKHDLIRSGEAFAPKLLQTLGYKLAKRLITQAARVLTAAIDAIDTPSTGCHTQDETAYALKVETIRRAKRLMGDEADALTTLFLDSACWFDLLYDMIANYSLDVVAGQVINNGKMESILGIRNIIISDLIPTVSYGDSTSGDDQHNSFLLGENCMYFAYQHEPEAEQDSNLLKPSTLNYLKISMDYVMHLIGVKWNSATTNPSDTDIATASNWDEAYADHREVRAVKMITKGACYTS